MENRDNQQGRSPFDIGWLAGIVDGEGCLQLAKQKRSDGGYYYRPMIIIGNTNPAIINAVKRVFRANNLPHYILYREKPAFRSKRPSWTITVMGLKRCDRVLRFIHPFLWGKLKQANIMRRFIEHRQSCAPTYPGKKTVTVIDDGLYWEMRKANAENKGETLRDYTSSRSNKERKI